MSLSAPNLPALTHKGDVAAFGLSYAVGFAVIAFIFGSKGPMPPSTVALVAGIADLSVKQGIETYWERALAEQSPTSEADRRERVSHKFAAFFGLFDDGVNVSATSKKGIAFFCQEKGWLLRGGGNQTLTTTREAMTMRSAYLITTAKSLKTSRTPASYYFRSGSPD